MLIERGRDRHLNQSDMCLCEKAQRDSDRDIGVADAITKRERAFPLGAIALQHA